MSDFIEDDFDAFIGDLNTTNPNNAQQRRSVGLMARSRKMAGERQDMSVPEIGGKLLEAAKVIPVAAAAGAVEGFVGLPGDIESLVRGLVTMAQRPENQGWGEALLEGIENKTIAPTIEDVKNWVNKNLVDFGDSPYETAGQFIAPSGYTKPIVKGVNAMKKLRKPKGKAK